MAVEVLCQDVQLVLDLQLYSTSTANKEMCP